MKDSATLVSSLVGEIKQDNVRVALEKVQSCQKADFNARCARKCLLEVQLLLSKNLNDNKEVVSSSDDIHGLAKKCLDTLELHEWDIGNQQLLVCAYYLIKFFLAQEKLSYCKDVCCTLQKWMSLNSARLSDSERDILSKSICHVLTYHLHQTDVKKFLATSSTNSLHLLFESCKIPTALQPENEIVFKNSMIAIRSLIQKSSSANIELTDSIHIDCSKIVLETCLKVGKNDVVAFMSFLEVLDACFLCTANKKNYQELSKILQLIQTAKKVFMQKDCNLCLDYSGKLIELILIDQGLVKGDFGNVCTKSCDLLEDLSTKNVDLMPWALLFLYKTFKHFPFEYKTHDSAFHNFSTLMKSACRIQKAIIGSNSAKTSVILMKLCAFVTNILCKIIDLPKDLRNSEDFLNFMFEFVQKSSDYCLALLVYDHENGCELKVYCKSLMERILFLVHLCYIASMHDKAYKLTFSFIEKLVGLSCDNSCHDSQNNANVVYKVASLSAQKIGKVDSFSEAILAAICKLWSKKLSVDEMFGNLTALRNCQQWCETERCLTFFELIAKRKNELVGKWNVPSSVVDEILKSTSIVWSELNVCRKLLQTSQGDLVLNVFKNLLKFKPSIVDAARGLVFVLYLSTKIHVDVGKLEKERLKIQESLRKQAKECGSYETILLLGSLLHYDTLFKIYAVRKKIQVKTVSWKAQEAPPNLNETGMFTDPNESCAPIASSELAFTKQLPLLDELEKSYNYLKAALQKMKDDCNDLDSYLEISHSIITLTAQLFTLYHFQEKATNAWKLLHSYGEKFSHQNMRLTAVTNLLKLQAEFDKSWMDDAMQIAASLSESSPERQLFYIYLAKSSLKSSQISEAVSHLEKVGPMYRNKKILTNFLLILGQVLLNPESRALWKGTPSSSINAFNQAFIHLYHAINTNDWEGFIEHCFLEETFLDTLMYLKRYSSSLMMPRLAYYYLTEQSSVVQKLAVPLRVAELLIAMAWVDVSVHKRDDCDLKLANVVAILGLEKKRHVIGGEGRPKKERGLSLADDVETSAHSSDGIMELMVTSHQVSPMSSRKKYEWSQILVHTAECACLSCRTPKFLQLTFDLLLLQAASYCIRQQYSQAIKYFHDALDYLQFLRGKGLSDDWLGGRQTVLYYFYNEMLITHKNYQAAALNISKMKQPIGMEIHGVTPDLIQLQKQNLMFINIKNRLKAKSAVPHQTLASLAPPNVASERTPTRPTHTPLLPRPPLTTSTKATAIAQLPVKEKRNLLVSAKTLDFGSSSDDDEVDVIDSTFVEQENNFASPFLAARKQRNNKLPAFVAQVPATTSARVESRVGEKGKFCEKSRGKNGEKGKIGVEKSSSSSSSSKTAPPIKPLKEKNETSVRTMRGRGKFEICSDPCESTSSRAVKKDKLKKTEDPKVEKPKRSVRAVRKQ